MPLLSNPAATIRSTALTQSPRPNYLRGELPQTMGYSIRSERFRYTEWRHFRSGAVQATELYDHSDDPLETVNRARDREYARPVTELARALSQRLSPFETTR